MLIRFELQKEGENVISFKILDQNDRLTFILKEQGFAFQYANKCMYIKSVNGIELNLNSNTIYLRGIEKSRDNNISRIAFSNSTERDSYYEIILCAFKALQNKYISIIN